MPLPQLPFNPMEEEENLQPRQIARPGGLPNVPIFQPHRAHEEESSIPVPPEFDFSQAEDEGEDLDEATYEEEDFGFDSTHEESSSAYSPAEAEDELDDITTKYTPEVMESVEMLLDVIASDDVSEVLMNGPDNILFKKAGSRYQIPDINLVDKDTYHQVINDFVLSQTDAKERIKDETYLIEGQMEWYDEDDAPPVLARVHIIAPPVVKFAKVTIAKKARHSYTIDDIADKGSMSPPMAEFLKAAAKAKVTTVFSGLSGAGKTTLLEAMSYYFDPNDRIIVTEDTPELRLPISDTVYLTTTGYKPGVDPNDVVSMDWLVRATNRMRPDRIIVGEVRGGEMAEFLIAANSGADGSMTTVHAADPRRTLDKMLSLSMKSESSKNENSVRRDIASTVQLIVQASLIDGRHVITHIEEVSNTIRENSGAIATQTLFEYDRNTGEHKAHTRPSEALQSYMAQRGVQVNPSWFQVR